LAKRRLSQRFTPELRSYIPPSAERRKPPLVAIHLLIPPLAEYRRAVIESDFLFRFGGIRRVAIESDRFACSAFGGTSQCL
jgi:hypothetical protein